MTHRWRGVAIKGVSNDPIQFESAHKIWPLLELLAKFDECSLARARKILQVLACSDFR